MKKILFNCFLVSLLLLFSCSKSLDNRSKSEISLDNYNKASNIINGKYVGFYDNPKILNEPHQEGIIEIDGLNWAKTYETYSPIFPPNNSKLIVGWDGPRKSTELGKLDYVDIIWNGSDRSIQIIGLWKSFDAAATGNYNLSLIKNEENMPEIYVSMFTEYWEIDGVKQITDKQYLYLDSLFHEWYAQINSGNKPWNNFVEINDYEGVKINGQIWMTKNLNVEKFRNGDKIFKARSSKEWLKALKEKKPAYCNYLDLVYRYSRIGFSKSFDFNQFGKYYNWYAFTDPRGLAPEGWKIPNREDFEKLMETRTNDLIESGGSGLDLLLGGYINQYGIAEGLLESFSYHINELFEFPGTKLLKPYTDTYVFIGNTNGSNGWAQIEGVNFEGANVRCIIDSSNVK